MSITIIGAGLGGLIVGSGSTFYLLNPRIRQAEAEKAALSAQLNTVTEQLHRLQRQVAALQYQVSHPPLDRAEPVPAPTEEPVAASVKLPQPPAPSLEEEAAVLFALHVARPADQLPADAAEMMPMPPAADAGELESESLEL